jgi:hypothetical protein
VRTVSKIQGLWGIPTPDEEAEAGIDCHSGPRGGGLTLSSFEVIGTDDAMMRWMDPEADGTTLPGVDLGEDTITTALKSPRLVGLWALGRYLHNIAYTELIVVPTLAEEDVGYAGN